MSNQQYSNENRGMLMRNPNKTADNHPDHSGSLNINGVEYWLSGWVKESKAGKKFLSLSVKPKDAQKPKKEDKFIDDNLDDVAF